MKDGKKENNMTLLEKYIETEKVRIKIDKAIEKAEGEDIAVSIHRHYDKPVFTVFHYSHAVSKEGNRGITVEINEGILGEVVFKVTDDNKFSKDKVKKLLDHAKMVFNTEF